jgi:hypothetical protein
MAMAKLFEKRPPVPLHLALVRFRDRLSKAATPTPLRPRSAAMPISPPRPAAKPATDFSHLRPVPALPAASDRRSPPPSDEADVFALAMLRADAKTRNEKFDVGTFLESPTPPPARHPTEDEILAAVRKARPSLLANRS